MATEFALPKPPFSRAGSDSGSDSFFSRSSRSASRRGRGDSFDSDEEHNLRLPSDLVLPRASGIPQPRRLSLSSEDESSMPPVRPAAGAALFTPVADPSYADFLQSLTYAMNTINSSYTGLWTQATDPSGNLINSWTNKVFHIKVSAIQDSTSGQASLVVEPTDAQKLKTSGNFSDYFKNMLEVMHFTGNKYSLVSPGVENLLKGLAADSGADISLVREGLKAAIADPSFKTRFEDCLHDSTKKAFEAQAALAPSAAASGPRGPGAGTTASASAAGAATTASAAGAGAAASPHHSMRCFPPKTSGDASGNGSGRDRALSL